MWGFDGLAAGEKQVSFWRSFDLGEKKKTDAMVGVFFQQIVAE